MAVVGHVGRDVGELLIGTAPLQAAATDSSANSRGKRSIERTRMCAPDGENEVRFSRMELNVPEYPVFIPF